MMEKRCRKQLHPRSARSFVRWALVWAFSLSFDKADCCDSSCPHRRLVDLTPSSPHYYNQLREEATDIQGPERAASDVYKVTDPYDSTRVYRLVELKAFISFSYDGTTVLERNGAGFAAMLALYHFNNIETSPLLNESDVSACKDLKFTMSMLDDWYNPIEGTRLFTRMMNSPKTFRNRPMAGIIGAYRSAVSVPVAILSGISHIPMISPLSSADDFDNKDQYPLFGRSYCNTEGEAQVAVDFFKSLGSTHVAVLTVTDAFGSALSKAFQDVANKAGITTTQVTIPSVVTQDTPELAQAMKLLAKTQYRHVYGIFFPLMLPDILKVAIQYKVVGPDYLYLLTGVTANALKEYVIDASDTELVKAMTGLAVISGSGGINDNRILAELSPGSKMAQSFAAVDKAWSVAHEDPEFEQFVRESFPDSLNSVPDYNASAAFDDTPTTSLQVYDAVTAMALAMCHSPNEFFTGEEVYDEFRQHEFYGASGLFRVDNFTGTRDYATLRWAIYNSRHIGMKYDGNASFDCPPSFHFVDNQWLPIQESPFIYASGSTEPPPCLPPPVIEFNYIGPTGRGIAHALMIITMLSAIVSVCWFCYYRSDPIIVSAEPLFLLLVSVGSFVMAAAIIPAGFEEMVVDNDEVLSNACMTIPWIYILGYCFTMSAMIAKLRGVHEALVHPEMQVITVTDIDLVTPLGVLLVLNVTILSCWTTIAPIHWERVYGPTNDEFGRGIESYGMCAPYDASKFFVMALAAVNFIVLVRCNWWAYTARNIVTDFYESSYIGLSVATMLQAWAIALPIIAGSSDNPQARYYVATGVIFVTSQAVLSLVYLPKVIALYRGPAQQTDWDGNGSSSFFWEGPSGSFEMQLPRTVGLSSGSSGVSTLSFRQDGSERTPIKSSPRGSGGSASLHMDAIREVSREEEFDETTIGEAAKEHDSKEDVAEEEVIEFYREEPHREEPPLFPYPSF